MGNKVFCPKKRKNQRQGLDNPSKIETESNSVVPAVSPREPSSVPQTSSSPENCKNCVSDEKLKTRLKNVQESLRVMQEQNRVAAAASAAAARATAEATAKAAAEATAKAAAEAAARTAAEDRKRAAEEAMERAAERAAIRAAAEAKDKERAAAKFAANGAARDAAEAAKKKNEGSAVPQYGKDVSSEGPPPSYSQGAPTFTNPPPAYSQQLGQGGPQPPASGQQFGPAGPQNPNQQHFGPQPLFNPQSGQSGPQQMFNQLPMGPPPMHILQGGPGGPHPPLFNQQGGPGGPPPMYLGPPVMGLQSGPIGPQFPRGPNYAPYHGQPLVHSTPKDFQGGPNQNDFQGGPNRNNFQGGPNRNNFQGRRAWQNRNEQGSQRRPNNQPPNQRGRDGSNDRTTNKPTTFNKNTAPRTVEPGSQKPNQKTVENKGAIPKVKNHQQFKPNNPKQKPNAADPNDQQKRKLFINNKKKEDAEKSSNEPKSNGGKLVLDLDDLSKLFAQAQSALGKGQDDKKGPTLDDLAKMFAQETDSPTPPPRHVPKSSQPPKKNKPQQTSPSASEVSLNDSFKDFFFGTVPNGEVEEEEDPRMSTLTEKFVRDMRIKNLALDKKKKKNPFSSEDDFVKISAADVQDIQFLSSGSDSDDSSVVSQESFTTALGVSNQPKKNLKKAPGKKPDSNGNKQAGNPRKNQPYSRWNPGKNGCLKKLVGKNKKIPSKAEAKAMGLEEWQFYHKVEGVILMAGPIIEKPGTVYDIIKFGQKHENAQANFIL